ncbi:YdcF family protein [Labilibacter sediminis]|nr:YdcF family protein [Labilibacter sediminis]
MTQKRMIEFSWEFHATNVKFKRMNKANIKITLLLGIFFLCCKCNKEEEPVSVPNPEPELEEKVDFDINYSFLESGSYVQDRNFYLFTLMQEISNVRSELENDEILTSFQNSFMSEVASLASNQSASIEQIADDMRISQSEMDAVASQLGNQLSSSIEIDKMIAQHARPSGIFQKYSSVSNKRMVELAWIAACEGINNIIEEYALGEEPRDKVSDGPAYNVNTEEYRKKTWEIVEQINQNKDDFTLFFEPALYFSLELLKLNNRDEAGKYEPLRNGENKSAIAYIPSVNWGGYTYASILLLGDSPNSPGDDVRISESAKIRVKLAADRYHSGKAPLIIISGANVYPFQTPYYEAVEMKKWMMDNYNVPEKAIIVDPHGRHTTTNLRNASRYIFRYGIPDSIKSIVTATESHIDYIVSNNYTNTCFKHFGYMPVVLKDRISINDVEFLPKLISLHADAIDPLDP